MPGSTRQSISSKIFLRTLMDARVKPGHDKVCLCEHVVFTTQLRDPAAQCARVVQKSFALSEGVGNAGCPLHPQPRVQCVGSTRVSSPQVTGTPGIPARNGFNGLCRALPGDEFVLSPSSTDMVLPNPVGLAKTSADLTPATGARTTRFCRTQQSPFVCALLIAHRPKPALPSDLRAGAAASTASHPASVTIMIRPSVGWDGDGYEVIWVSREGKYF